jgi:UDP-2,3-diacylglucosamine hydrolase
VIAGAELVCGTRIEAAADDARARTLLLSDLHVTAPGDAPACDLERVLADAERQAAATRVLILGDLFDAFVTPRQLRVGIWAQVAARLARATAAGVSVTVLHGNRDFMLGPEFAAHSGARVVAGGLRCRLAGRPALLLHGDELLWNDRPYQRAKRWLRHRATRALLGRLPLWLALHLAGRARRASEYSTAGAEPERFAPVGAAVDEAFATGAELLVFGHIHRPARGRRGAGEYCILPAFDAGGVLLEAGPAGLRFRDAAGATVADYPAREFGQVGSFPAPAAR